MLVLVKQVCSPYAGIQQSIVALTPNTPNILI